MAGYEFYRTVRGVDARFLLAQARSDVDRLARIPKTGIDLCADLSRIASPFAPDDFVHALTLGLARDDLSILRQQVGNLNALSGLSSVSLVRRKRGTLMVVLTIKGEQWGAEYARVHDGSVWAGGVPCFVRWHGLAHGDCYVW